MIAQSISIKGAGGKCAGCVLKAVELTSGGLLHVPASELGVEQSTLTVRQQSAVGIVVAQGAKAQTERSGEYAARLDGRQAAKQPLSWPSARTSGVKLQRLMAGGSETQVVFPCSRTYRDFRQLKRFHCGLLALGHSSACHAKTVIVNEAIGSAVLRGRATLLQFFSKMVSLKTEMLIIKRIARG